MHKVGDATDPRWQPEPPGPARRLQPGDSFSYATPGPEHMDFSGPGGEEARKGVLNLALALAPTLTLRFLMAHAGVRGGQRLYHACC